MSSWQPTIYWRMLEILKIESLTSTLRLFFSLFFFFLGGNYMGRVWIGIGFFINLSHWKRWTVDYNWFLVSGLFDCGSSSVTQCIRKRLIVSALLVQSFELPPTLASAFQYIVLYLLSTYSLYFFSLEKVIYFRFKCAIFFFNFSYCVKKIEFRKSDGFCFFEILTVNNPLKIFI